MTHHRQYPTYEYTIRRPDGKHYTGSIHGDDRDWSDPGDIGNPPFKYSKSGADKKMLTFPYFFKNCTIGRN